MTDSKTILRAVRQIPTISQSFTKMATLIGDEKASMKDFEKVLKPDPVLTAGILRMANSPYFGTTREITSVGHALMLLGSKRIFDLSASMALAGILPKYIAGYEMTTKNYWSHCIAVAVFAERMAEEFNLRLSSPPFTAGLLHDIGKLVIGVFLAERADEVLERIRSSDDIFVAVESQLLGVDHSEVGASLARKWKLPDSIKNVIRWHHDPDQAKDDQVLVDLIHAADALAHAVGYGADVGELSREVQPGVSKRLNITRPQLELIVAESMEQIRELEETLNSNGGD